MNNSPQKITRKGIVKEQLAKCLSHQENIDTFVMQLDQEILFHRVKFPLLEFCAIELFERFSPNEHFLICDEIGLLNREGGNVIIGKLLQLNLPQHLSQSLDKATFFIEQGAEWYVSDIIGERVFGEALLQFPDASITYLESLTNHPSNWVVRSIGSGTHYAVKKGLLYPHVQTMFRVLLSLSDSKDYQIKRGIGWAAKTIAKFHPDIIYDHQELLENDPNIGKWFKTKISIGLARHTYATGKRG